MDSILDGFSQGLSLQPDNNLVDIDSIPLMNWIIRKAIRQTVEMTDLW